MLVLWSLSMFGAYRDNLARCAAVMSVSIFLLIEGLGWAYTHSVSKIGARVKDAASHGRMEA